MRIVNCCGFHRMMGPKLRSDTPTSIRLCAAFHYAPLLDLHTSQHWKWNEAIAPILGQ